MGEMLPDFLAVQGASTASKCLLLDAKDHLRASTVYGSSPTFNSRPTYKIGRAPLPPLADTPLQETKLLHNFLTLRTDFALIYSLFYLSLLLWETEKATSMALFACAPQGKLTETFIMLLCIEHFFDQSD